jgi:hypothetical protein
MGACSGQYVGCAIRFCQTCLTLERAGAGADRLGLRPTDVNPSAKFSDVQTEDGRPGGFLHETEPSSHHCLTHRQIEFADGTSC